MDKIRELFEEKELRSARLRVKWNGARYEPRDSSNQWHVDFACKVNLSLDMFKAGYEAAKASQWISVEDSPKGISANYMAYRPDAPIGAKVCALWFDPMHNGWSGIYKVTHWMPLPEGPTECQK